MSAWNKWSFGAGRRSGAIGWRGVLPAAAVVLAWGAAPGCVPSAGSHCKKVCDCIGCDEAAEATCVDNFGDAQHRANAKDCGDKFNAFFSCLDGQTTCVDGVIDDDGCDQEAAALTACAGDIGVIYGSSCQSMCERSSKECNGGDGSECAASCEQSDKFAQTSGCGSEYSALLSCYSAQSDICSASNFCSSESNDYVNCFITFCNNNPGTPGC